MANGRMATVSLTGVKSFVDEVPNETGEVLRFRIHNLELTRD
jgi:hypothetical protein